MPFDHLPQHLPLFPLPGALLLPRARLPLNIFEPRYMAMVEDAMGQGRLIGMVQPKTEQGTNPPLYRVGCAGRIVSFSETDDGRFLIVLQGVARFAVSEETVGPRGYRIAAPVWQDYADDLSDTEDKLSDAVHAELVAAVRPYFKAQQIIVNWETIEEAPAERLVNSLVAACPFADSEKQALLESPTLETRVTLLLALMQMAARQHPDLELVRH